MNEGVIDSLVAWCGGLNEEELSFKTDWMTDVCFKFVGNKDGFKVCCLVNYHQYSFFR